MFYAMSNNIYIGNCMFNIFPV